MSFEEIASHAGKYAAEIGRQAERPAFTRLLSRRRRTSLVSAWSLAAVTVVGFVVIALVWSPGETPDGPVVSPTVAGVPASCPVTVPGEAAFTPASAAPDDPPEVYDDVWFGTPDLWTLIDPGGEVWSDLPKGADGSLTERTFWWSANYSADDPGEFTVTAEHLSGTAPQFEASQTGGTGFNPFMTQPTHESVTVVGLDFPDSGCWSLTAEYKGSSLSYVVWVEDENVGPATTVATTAPTTTTLAAQVPADGPIFGEETGMVLLLDDGLEGLIAFDPDARRAAASLVEGQRPGDEAFSMVRIGDKLVVGWENIYAVDIATRQSLSLGSATAFVPSATETNVWLVDYPGGRVGLGRPTVWQVNSAGETTSEPRELNSDSLPVFGIDGGLALSSDEGIELWDGTTGEVRTLLGGGPGFAHDVSGDTLAWCSEPCDILNLTNTSDLTSQRYDAPEGMRFGENAFSDDGRYLAAIVAPLGDAFNGASVLLLDRESGVTTTFADPGSGPIHFVTWAPDNDQLFATGYSYGEGTTPIWHYRLSTGELTTAVIPVGGAITPVVIDRSVADEYFTADVAGF